jgi:hypothetical protein
MRLSIKRRTAAVIAAIVLGGGGAAACTAAADAGSAHAGTTQAGTAGAGTAQAATTCGIGPALNGHCGPYHDNARPTFIENQDIGAAGGTTATVNTDGYPAPSGGDVFSSVVHAGADGGAVQVYPSIQEQFYGWTGTGWGGGSGDGPGNVPLSALSQLTVNYSETSPQDSGSQYEWGVDVWTNYTRDVMFWTDTTSGRCMPGGYGQTDLGQLTLNGKPWTATLYGAAGGEIILYEDGSSGNASTCARQPSGSIDVKGGLNWLATHDNSRTRFPTTVTVALVNSGWEVTQADGTTFKQDTYSINTGQAGGSTSASTQTTSAPPAPAAPTIVSSGNEKYFLWAPVAGASDYQAEIENSSGTVLRSLEPQDSTWTKTGLTPQDYLVQVRALVNGTWSAWSTAESFT